MDNEESDVNSNNNTTQTTISSFTAKIDNSELSIANSTITIINQPNSDNMSLRIMAYADSQ